MTKVRSITYIGIFAALTAILSQISVPIPFTPVPVNLATFSIFIATSLLGTTRSVICQGIYCLVGAIGLPVFVGFNGGFGALLGPTGGYIIGYIALAFVMGLTKSKMPKTILFSVISMLLGLIACYALGTVWFIFIMDGMDLIKALTLCVLPFILGDILKISLAAFVVKRLENRISLVKT